MKQASTDTAHLAANLRLLCGFKSSVSEVARSLGLNRSQLNKYLRGSTMPRPALLRKIGDYFGVDVHEILMPAEDFARLIGVREIGRSRPGHHLQNHLELLLSAADPRAQQMVGRFFEYYHSMSTPGWLLRSLIVFDLWEGLLVYRRFERVARPGELCRRRHRYQGVALMLADRIMLVDHESALRNEVTQTILYPDYARSLNTLLGVKLGISANHLRAPCAARVVLERAPSHVSLMTQLRRCGLFSLGDNAIPPQVWGAVDNTASGPHHFLAPTAL